MRSFSAARRVAHSRGLDDEADDTFVAALGHKENVPVIERAGEQAPIVIAPKRQRCLNIHRKRCTK
jgi:hypothetical protein